jgi:transcriptional regulator with XRE-family HTH domain
MSTVAGLAIVSRRHDAGLSRRELARRAGTSAATLGKYESGVVTPGVETLERILDSALPRRRRWSSLGSLAATIYDDLTAGHEADAWRTCTEVIDDERSSSDEETLLFASRYPPPTGNPRADAVVAALGEWVCVRRKLPTPPWTNETRVCRPFWFINPLQSFQLAAMRESPASFAARGIFVLERDLTTA